METLSKILTKIDSAVWGPVTLVLLVGTGVFLTFRLRFLPWRYLPKSLKAAFSPESRKTDSGEGDISPFSALMTALAGTIGTGNIVGVATAMVLGGPGALVWMWIAAAFGISTKYAECALAIKFREKNENGEMCGGPMYTIKNGFKHKKIAAILAALFAVFTLFASFGIGNLSQANSISSSLNKTFSVPTWVTGIALAVFTAFIIFGGIKSISKVSSVLVPIMAVFYIVSGLIVIFANIKNVPAGLATIWSMAFGGRAVAGGLSGAITASVMQSVRYGVARGVFSNEAGLGSAPIAAAAAQTKEPVRQGLVSMTGTFIDTIVICTMTGLSIVLTGAWQVEGLEGVQVTTYAFQHGLPIPGQISAFVLMICLVFFAFTTILGWDYYSERCLEYLTNGHKKTILTYRWLYILAVFIGPYMTVSAVWTIADIFNGLMAIPNMIALFALSGVIVKETKAFFAAEKHKM